MVQWGFVLDILFFHIADFLSQSASFYSVNHSRVIYTLSLLSSETNRSWSRIKTKKHRNPNTFYSTGKSNAFYAKKGRTRHSGLPLYTYTELQVLLVCKTSTTMLGLDVVLYGWTRGNVTYILVVLCLNTMTCALHWLIQLFLNILMVKAWRKSII